MSCDFVRVHSTNIPRTCWQTDCICKSATNQLYAYFNMYLCSFPPSTGAKRKRRIQPSTVHLGFAEHRAHAFICRNSNEWEDLLNRPFSRSVYQRRYTFCSHMMLPTFDSHKLNFIVDFIRTVCYQILYYYSIAFTDFLL